MVRLSDSEIYIMHLVWENKKITSFDILKQAEKNKKISEKSVRTLLRRLVKKKALIVTEKNSRTYTYETLIDKEEYINFESNLFLNNVYKGNAKLLLLNLIKKHKETNKEELQEIYNMFKKK